MRLFDLLLLLLPIEPYYPLLGVFDDCYCPRFNRGGLMNFKFNRTYTIS